LLEACEYATTYPIFILDPHFANPDTVGPLRYSFLLDSLTDLDISLRRLGSRLYLFQGKPDDIFPILFEQWKIDLLTFEVDSEPYAVVRDSKIEELAGRARVEVHTCASHTLHDLEAYMPTGGGGGAMKSTYAGFTKMFSSMSPPRLPMNAPLVVNIIIYICHI
jgi:cryptochrome